MINVTELLQALIRCPSVTPVDAGAQVLLAAELTKLGFECHHLPFGEGEEETPNLFARLGTQGPHLCFAGHTDVVPPGDENAWTFGPFNPEIKDGVMYGRGASDMKGGVAAFVAGVAAYLENNQPKGSISLLITGDEEGRALHGTVKVLEWMKAHGHVPDVAIVGEPTNPATLGQEIKIGRRGSLRGFLSVTGKQGHVAYPHLAENPLPALVKLLDALADYEFDAGNTFFPPTNLEITTIDVGNAASNIIPAQGKAAFNIRFNDHWSRESLIAKVTEILDSVSEAYEITFEGEAESFLTQPGDWSDIVRGAVQDVTGKTAEFTTNGGTSDARFVVQYCPVVEFGGINATIHQVDENIRIDDLEKLTKIYTRVLERYFA